MGVIVPQQYAGYVSDAAKALGIPDAVVGEQIAYESSFDPNAKSSAGAEGIAQFEPGTFATYGPKGGSPWNVGDSFYAYKAYMKELLKEEGGDLRKALAAYNAGPGNLAAGYGYADHILSQAGKNDIHVGTGGSSGGDTSILGGLLNIPGDVFKSFTSWGDKLAQTSSLFTAFFQPSTYVRLGAGALGGILLIFGIVCLGLAAAGKD